MPKPRIVGETRREVEEREPPKPTSVMAHEWLSEESLQEFEKTISSGRPFRVYLSDKAERKIRAHALKEAPGRLEVMGLLLGEVRTWRGITYAVVSGVVTTNLRSSSSKVRFDPLAFPKLFHELDDSGFDYILVGWYHSHPGHTCFLSRTDLETQRTMFREPYHSAIVIDPINREIKAFRLSGEGYIEMPFALFKDETGDGKKKPRKRKLKVTPVTMS